MHACMAITCQSTARRFFTARSTNTEYCTWINVTKPISEEQRKYELHKFVTCTRSMEWYLMWGQLDSCSTLMMKNLLCVLAISTSKYHVIHLPPSVNDRLTGSSSSLSSSLHETSSLGPSSSRIINAGGPVGLLPLLISLECCYVTACCSTVVRAIFWI